MKKQHAEWQKTRAPVFAVCLVAVLAPFLAISGSAYGESLNEALAKAYQSNPRLQAQQASLRATDEQLPQALSNWRPTVVINGSAGIVSTTRDTPTAPETTDDTQPRSVNLTVSQPIFRGFRTRAETARANNNIAAGRADLMQVEQDVLFDAVVAYANVVRETAVLELNRANEAVLQRQLEATQDRFSVGELTRTDVAQAESSVARAVSTRIDSQNAFETASAQYKNIIGVQPSDLTPAKEPAIVPDTRAAAIEAALTNNPAVISAEFRERSARDSVDLIRGELLPTVTVDGSLSSSDDSVGKDVEQQRAQLLAKLRVPLYQSGSVSSRVREAKQVASQRLLQLFSTRREAERAATDSWESLQASRGRVTSFEAETRAQEIALEGVRQEQQVGSRTILDVLDAEQALLDARVGLVRAQRDTIADSANLLSTIGMLTAQDLGLQVNIYDFNRHLDQVRNKVFGTSIER
ncbi:MAG: TolC family outer membrane protein [Alphaproteobacteria bacterium]